MASNMVGISSYQQTNQIWKNNQKSSEAVNQSSASTGSEQAQKASGSQMKLTEWKPLTAGSSLIPTTKEGYGTVIGNVELSDQAKDYYNTLKDKFHGMEFILVSKDMKSQVASNALAYGNANKPVVLIDDEKLERMATDEAYRKKYEGIIAMSQEKLLAAKNSLVSSGANVKNFGMSVSEDGRSSFFASVEKANDQAGKLQEKRLEAKKEAKVKAKKKAEKEEKQERLEKKQEEKKSEQAQKKAELEEKKLEKAQEKAEAEKSKGEATSKADALQNQMQEDVDSLEAGFPEDNNSYVEFRADSIESLVNQVAKYASISSMNSVLTPAETMVGQSIDFKG